MHPTGLTEWSHDHDFSSVSDKGERRTLYVLILTAIVMVVEILAGNLFGSMALLADGWHMGTHVAAFMIAIFAYRYARKHAKSAVYTFGTGKVSVLGGFSSAIALAVVALVMLLESLQRIFDPQTIRFGEAIAVAVLGLLVNIVSALLLSDGHHHPHPQLHSDAHEHHAHDHDHNLRAAYLHVLADALTSVLAIVALVLGMYLGWNWLDPVMGIVGAMIIARWSVGLLRQTSPILLDGSLHEAQREQVIEAIERDSDNKLSDLHIWKVGPAHYAAILSVVTAQPKAPEHYKSLLEGFPLLSHVTIEVNPRN